MGLFNRFANKEGKPEESQSKEKEHSFSRYIQNKKKYIVIGTTIGVIVSGISFGIYNYKTNAQTLYHVFLDGKEVGIVDNKEVIESWEKQQIALAEGTYGNVMLEPQNEITFEKEVKYKGKFDNMQTINSLKDQFVIKAQGVEIIIDGKAVGIVKDQATADKIFKRIRESYLPESTKTMMVAAEVKETDKDKKFTSQLESINVKEEITTKETTINPSEILNEEDMLSLLKKGSLEEKKYVVKAGDTISEIAQKFGLTTNQIYQLNPDISGELIRIGDELTVTDSKPFVTVETEEKVTKLERVYFKVVYEKSNSMYTNESKVKQQGKEGSKEVEYSVKKENGNIIERKILSEKIIEEPQDKIIVKGTKKVYSKGTGQFIWPTVGGTITSYFGPRWGRVHEGIDIARVSDYTIKAADSGKVIFAGWKSGYGNAIMIDHGNGYVTLYGHMSKLVVSVGQKVGKGQKIGVMGSTGRSTGTHLHFEVRVNGKYKNPLNYVSK